MVGSTRDSPWGPASPAEHHLLQVASPPMPVLQAELGSAVGSPARAHLSVDTRGPC